MKKSITTLFAVSILLFTTEIKAQQQPLYSQYVFNGVVINPAHMSLENEYSNVTIMNRQQWVGIPGAPRTFTLSFSTPINATKTSVGLLAVQDKAGVNTLSDVNLLLSQSINLSENAYLSVGVNAGVNILNQDNLSLNQSIDPKFSQNINSTKMAVGLGITFFTDRFFAGISSPSFRQLALKNKEYYLQDVTSYYFSSGYLFDISPMLKFKPTILLKKIGGGYIQAEGTANFLLNNVIWVGLGWRQEESIIGITQIQLTNNIKLCYSYDYLTQKELQSIQKGSHEIALSFRFGSKGRIVSPSYF